LSNQSGFFAPIFPRSRSPPLPNLNFHKSDFRLEKGLMNDNARCFIFCKSGYEEISYAELQKRRTDNPSYADKRFIPLHGMLMEVTEADYHDIVHSLIFSA
jgi:hypothetical protein